MASAAVAVLATALMDDASAMLHRARSANARKLWRRIAHPRGLDQLSLGDAYAIRLAVGLALESFFERLRALP